MGPLQFARAACGAPHDRPAPRRIFNIRPEYLGVPGSTIGAAASDAMLCRYVLLADPSTGGVDLGAKNEKGRTALALAALHGEARRLGS